MTAPQIVRPREHDLGGGFVVRRLLPAAARRAVGPFVFFDHFGPVDERPQDNHDVRPHPHIGLATVTYLFEGAMLHRDSLGSRQRIEPGAINWMTAGRGIAHSERKPVELRTRTYRSHGIQLWVALPRADEEAEPSFEHTPAEAIPELDIEGVRVRVLIGDAWGASSPVKTRQAMLYLDLRAGPDAALMLDASSFERAVYSVDNPIEIDGLRIEARTLAVLPNRVPVYIDAPQGARCVVIGGEALDAPRHMWWNFVSSRIDRIEQAKDDWRNGRFTLPPDDRDEFIPLPDR